MEQKISVIIPAYNIESYLPATLDAALVQTHKNLEIIVVNDGSKDGTAAVLDAYARKDSRIRAIHKENGGVTSARLRGVQESTGEWIIFCDGDDIPEPGMYAHLLNNALKYDAEISHCGYQMVFPNGRVDFYHGTGCLVEQDHLQGLRDLITGEMVEPSLVNKLYRRELFAGLDAAMDSSFKINEDVLMNYHLFKEAKRSVFEDLCLYSYVLRSGSATTSRQLNEHKLMDPLRVTKAIMADAEPGLRDVLTARLTRQLIGLATISAKAHPELILPHRKDARKELRARIWDVLRERIGAKQKVMALWVAVWPASYGWVHSAYARFTGLDKIYDLE